MWRLCCGCGGFGDGRRRNSMEEKIEFIVEVDFLGAERWRSACYAIFKEFLNLDEDDEDEEER